MSDTVITVITKNGQTYINLFDFVMWLHNNGPELRSKNGTFCLDEIFKALVELSKQNTV